MKPRGKTFTAILAGGVLLASAAYGIGTQVGGGGAAAADDDSSSRGERREMRMRMRMDGGRRPGLAALAKKLGVSEDKLRSALEEIRGETKPPADRRAGLAADLAKELGVSEDKVEAALEKAHPRMHRRVRGVPRRFAAALAKELGIEASKVRSVFRSLRSDRGERHDLADVAQRLGVTEADLRAALEKVRPAMRPRRDRLEGRLAPALAKELDLDVDDVRAALRKLRANHESEHKARREAFARKLAEKLDIPVDKVLAALPRRGPGHPGRGGPGRMHHRFGGPGGPGGPPGMARPGSFAPDGPPPGPAGGGLKF